MSESQAVKPPNFDLEAYVEQLFSLGQISASEKTYLLMLVEMERRKAAYDATQQFEDEKAKLVKKVSELALYAEQHVIASQPAVFDKKTGLYTGEHFDFLFGVVIELIALDKRRHDRRRPCPCLVVGDVCNLKWYNDNHGHAMGDTLLCAVGETIRQHVRTKNFFGQEDIASRAYGHGDEVEILINVDDPFDAKEAAQKIKSAFTDRKDWSEYDALLNEKPPNVDFGAAAINGMSLFGIFKDEEPVKKAAIKAELLAGWRKKADELMYLAKQKQSEVVEFAWFNYDSDSRDLVDITPQFEKLGKRSKP